MRDVFCYFEWSFVFLECGFRCYFLGGSFLGVWFRVTGSGPPCFKPLCPGPPSLGPANPGPPFSRTPSAAPASLNRPLSGQGLARTPLHRTFQERSWSPPFLDRHAFFLWFVWLLTWTASPEPLSPGPPPAAPPSPRTALRRTLLPLNRPLPSPPFTGTPPSLLYPTLFPSARPPSPDPWTPPLRTTQYASCGFATSCRGRGAWVIVRFKSRACQCLRNAHGSSWSARVRRRCM